MRGGKDALKNLKRKLNSERGASITWALLIFLVCTVVGSAVLVAGTAAAGRMSKLAESDQRYYAVTSAAGLLSDVLGQEIKTTRTAGSAEVVYKTSNSNQLKDNLMKSVIGSVTGWRSMTNADQLWKKDLLEKAANLTLTLNGGSGISNVINDVKIVLSFGEDGSALAEISKGGYTLRLSFELIRSMETELVSEKETKIDSFQWVLREASKVESTPTSTGG